MVYLMLAKGFEEIEAVTVIDILRRAGIELQTVSLGEKNVTGAHTIPVQSDIAFDEMQRDAIDMLILPGGMPGTTHLQQDVRLAALLTELAARGTYIAAICAAPLILGELGLLKDKHCTVFAGFEEHLKGAVLEDLEVVLDLPFITARAAGAAGAFAFEIVRLLKGGEKADALRKAMRY